MYDSDAANLYSPVFLHSERLVSALYWKNAHEYMVCSAQTVGLSVAVDVAGCFLLATRMKQFSIQALQMITSLPS